MMKFAMESKPNNFGNATDAGILVDRYLHDLGHTAPNSRENVLQAIRNYVHTPKPKEFAAKWWAFRQRLASTPIVHPLPANQLDVEMQEQDN